MPAGDDAVEHDGRIVAAVERKSLADLSSTLTTGKLRYLLAELAEPPRAALVVEDRYSAVFKSTFVAPGVLAEAQVRFPGVPIVFCETRPLAPAAPTAAEIRAWANANGHEISAKGRIPSSVRAAFDAAT